MKNLQLIIEFLTIEFGFMDVLYLLTIICGMLLLFHKRTIVSTLFLIGLVLSICSYVFIPNVSFTALTFILAYVGAVSTLYIFLSNVNVRSRSTNKILYNTYLGETFFILTLFNIFLNIAFTLLIKSGLSGVEVKNIEICNLYNIMCIVHVISMLFCFCYLFKIFYDMWSFGVNYSYKGYVIKNKCYNIKNPIFPISKYKVTTLPINTNRLPINNIYSNIYLQALDKQYYSTSTFLGISAGIILSRSYSWLPLGFAFLGMTSYLSYLKLKQEGEIIAVKENMEHMKELHDITCRLISGEISNLSNALRTYNQIQWDLIHVAGHLPDGVVIETPSHFFNTHENYLRSVGRVLAQDYVYIRNWGPANRELIDSLFYLEDRIRNINPEYVGSYNRFDLMVQNLIQQININFVQNGGANYVSFEARIG